MIQSLAEKLFHCLMLDIWPDGPAAAVDFGLDGWNGTDPDRVYAAYQRAVRAGEITAEQLSEALGNGPQLTKLLRAAKSNPDKKVQVFTVYDDLRKINAH